jgi:hypothetical protein
MKILPLLIVIMIVAAACAPAPVLRDDALLSDDSLISGEPCAAPCFRGIIPGETSWSDALTIINDDLQFKNVQTQGPEEDNPAIQISWQQGDEAPVCCQMVTQDGETVSLIFIRTAPEHDLGELIAAHGPPTYLAGQDFTEDQAIMSLVYPDTPMVIYAFVEGAETGALSESSEVIGALYFVKDDMDLLLQTTELHVWEGYQSYADYNEGEFEVTPSVTLTPTAES